MIGRDMGRIVESVACPVCGCRAYDPAGGWCSHCHVWIPRREDVPAGYSVWIELRPDYRRDPVPANIGRWHTLSAAPVWRAAGLDLDRLDGAPVAAAVPLLDAALAALAQVAPGTFAALGGHEGAVRFLREIRGDCAAHPGGFVRVDLDDQP